MKLRFDQQLPSRARAQLVILDIIYLELNSTLYT